LGGGEKQRELLPPDKILYQVTTHLSRPGKGTRENGRSLDSVGRSFFGEKCSHRPERKSKKEPSLTTEKVKKSDDKVKVNRWAGRLVTNECCGYVTAEKIEQGGDKNQVSDQR